ncbi:MAG: TetR family transcriptional regulator, partial [Hyphomicrobiaceae bacterium]
MVQAKLAPRPRIEDQSRWRILAAAADQFANQGYAATSIRDIAREV